MNVFHAITSRATLPRLTLAQRVVDKMVANATVYETETGESLVGFAMKGLGRLEPDLYVIETIPPDESAIRRGAYFEQGDDLQGDIFNWWFDNWNQYRSRRRGSYGNAIGAKWDVPLTHLGDWHKHPGTLIEPSWGDTDTAREHIMDDESGSPQLLAILATVWDKVRADAFDAVEADDPADGQPRPIKVPIDNDSLVRLDCWYMSRLTRRFVRLAATVVPDKTLPNLPIIGWHLSQPHRWSQEIDALRAEGYAVSVEQYDADQQPPLEICLALAKRTSHKVIVVTTQADFPDTMPTIRTAPIAAMRDVPEKDDLFLNLWGKSTPLPKDAYPAWDWSPNRTLVELVRAVEAKLTEDKAEGSAV